MLVHNSNWSIIHDEDGYWIVPPPGQPGKRQLVRSRSAALHDMIARG